MPPLSDKELEERLSSAGSSLLQPPFSCEDLLPLLDQLEELLSKVEQSPAKSMQNSLSPLMNALVTEQLLKHSDVDVKVGVASCISEITRITAPDTPYDDDKMKEVFHLIVSSFENLSDTSSRSYDKRASILETVAKVRSCVIMLDLECDQLIIDMFNHFLNAIRDYHEEAIFGSMETIMTLVLEESEDIPSDLLNTILITLKRNNEEVLLIAKKLAERVIHNCADKLKPYLKQTLKTLHASLDDYSEVVVSLCEVNSGTCGGHSDESISKDQMVNNDCTVEANMYNKDASVNVSPKSIETNCIIENVTDANHSIKDDSNLQSDDLGAQEPANLEANVDRAAKRKRQDSNSRNSSSESSDLLDDKKQAEEVPNSQETPGKDSSPDEALPAETSKSLDDVKDSSNRDSQSVALGNEEINVASPTESIRIPDECLSNKSSRAKRKGKLRREETVSAGCASNKESKGMNIPDAKNHPLTKKSGKMINKDKFLTEEVLTKNDGIRTNDSETKSLDQAEKFGDASSKKEEESLSKKGTGKKGTRIKPKDMVVSPTSPVKSTKYEGNSEETPRIKSNIKQSPGTDKISGTADFDENLVDSKVRVWWPKDKRFYEGVITSFDSLKKKHMILYSDGEKEVLNLKRERWELIQDESVSDMGPSVEQSDHGASPDMKKKRKGDNTDSEASSKRGKMEGSSESEPKSSVKLKDATAKSGRKSGGKVKNDGKIDAKSKVNEEPSGKSEDDAVKYKEQLPKPKTKSQEDSSKAPGRSKDIDDGNKDIDDGKSSSHLKNDSQQMAKSKGKAQQGSIPRSANGTGNTKKETNQTIGKALNLEISEETVKRKSPGNAKSRGSVTQRGKRGKKRRK